MKPKWVRRHRTIRKRKGESRKLCKYSIQVLKYDEIFLSIFSIKMILFKEEQLKISPKLIMTFI